MEIKYYGIEGASIDEYFSDPEYYISEIIAHKKDWLSKTQIRDSKGDIDWIVAKPYENGVVFSLTRQPYPPGPSKYDARTSASIVVDENGASFIIKEVDRPEEGYTEEQIKEAIKANIEKEQELISKLGNELAIDKITSKSRSSNIFTRKKEAAQEKEQREKYVAVMTKQLEELEQLSKQTKEVNNIEKVEPIDIVEYVKKGIENGTLTFEEAQKFQRITAKQGIEGQKVQTILSDGTVETDEREVKIDEKTGEPGWVVNNVNGPEQWIIEDSTFKKKYEVDPENPDVYKPKGGPMLAAQINEDLTFQPPRWNGDIQNIKAGGYLLMDPTDEEDIYGIGQKEFLNSYKYTNDMKREI